MFYAQSTGAVISGRYTSHIVHLIFNNVCLKMGLYTVFKPCLKGENTNITKNDLRFKKNSKNINFFQKVKNLFRWNILKQHAQWFSCKVALSGEVDTTEWWNGWFVWPYYRKIKGKLSGGNWCWDIRTRSSLVNSLSCLTSVLRHIYRTVAGAVEELSGVNVETHTGLSLTQSIGCLASMLRYIIIRDCRWCNRWVVWRQGWEI